MIVATLVAEELQVAEAVRSRVLLSEYVPVAVNCCVLPTVIAGFRGVTAIDESVTIVKLEPLLATPPTVTTTLPVVAPVGTVVVMLVALQFPGVTVAVVPLNLTVLVPCVPPKFEPAIVTDVPTGPDAGVKPEMDGAEPEAKMYAESGQLL